MENIVGSRIQARLEALGKNPSGVALEAGLGRSSVRDIILGRVSHPRIDTLKKIAGPLRCTVDYLTGDSESPDAVGIQRHLWHMDATIDVPIVVEAGVYRRPRPRAAERIEENVDSVLHVLLKDPRLPHWWAKIYVMNDNSMAAIGIYKGDGLTGVSQPYDQQIPLTHGSVVAVRQSVSDLGLEEISVRQVQVSDEGIRLSCPGADDIPDLIIANHSIDNESRIISNYYGAGKSGVEILHLITRVTRELPLSEAVYDFPHELD